MSDGKKRLLYIAPLKFYRTVSDCPVLLVYYRSLAILSFYFKAMETRLFFAIWCELREKYGIFLVSFFSLPASLTKFPRPISRDFKRKAESSSTDLCIFALKMCTSVLRFFNPNLGQCKMKFYFFNIDSCSCRLSILLWNFYTQRRYFNVKIFFPFLKL